MAPGTKSDRFSKDFELPVRDESLYLFLNTLIVILWNLIYLQTECKQKLVCFSFSLLCVGIFTTFCQVVSTSWDLMESYAGIVTKLFSVIVTLKCLFGLKKHFLFSLIITKGDKFFLFCLVFIYLYWKKFNKKKLFHCFLYKYMKTCNKVKTM